MKFSVMSNLIKTLIFIFPIILTDHTAAEWFTFELYELFSGYKLQLSIKVNGLQRWGTGLLYNQSKESSGS